MARQAEFIINGTSIMSELQKVDGKKIYGWSTLEVFYRSGSQCKLAKDNTNWDEEVFYNTLISNVSLRRSLETCVSWIKKLQ
jgi:hypothetical protein